LNAPPRDPLPTLALDRPVRHPSLYVSFSPDGRTVLENGLPSGRLEASRELLDVVALCDGSRTQAEIAAALPWSEPSEEARATLVRVLVERLRQHGLLLDEAGAAPATADYGYARPEIHRTMLLDHVRTDAFREAMRAVVRPGDTVVDMGAGSGVLCMFAAEAGAKEVHGIECSAIIEPARRVLELNGHAAVQLHQGDAETLDLPVQADVIVSEWLGYFVYADGMYPAFAALRDRCLKPGGRVVPAEVDVLLAPMEDRDPRGHSYWYGRPYGFDFSPLLEQEYRFTQIRLVPTEALLAPGQVLDTIDCRRAGMRDLHVTRSARWRLERGGQLDAVCGWFTARLAPGVVMETAPGAPDTHWQQHVFAVRPVRVEAGDALELTLRVSEAPYDSRLVRIALEGRVLAPDGSLRGEFAHQYDQ
jgi:SAM-dependent methyltransferase